MSLSNTPETQNPPETTSTPRFSSWVELFAIPIAISIMEAQALTLALILATAIFAGTNTPSLGAIGITLLELGLMWWAMLVEHLTRRHIVTKSSVNTLLIAGWVVALAAVIIPALLQGQSIVQAVILLILTTWLWRRGIAHAQQNFEYNSVALPFKIGLGVVLVALFIVTIMPGLPSLHAALPISLPVFFLSGLIAVSLARLGTLRTARTRADEAHTDPTRSWLLALAIFGLALVVLVLIIDSIFSLSTLEAIITTLDPLWSAISTVVTWLLYGIVFLLSPIFYFIDFIYGLMHETPAKPIQQKGSPVSGRPITPAETAFVAQILAVGRWILLALILLAVFFVVVRTIQRWLRRHDDGGVEEIRERLDARSLLADRWRAWRNRRRRQAASGPALEPLDPLSARARYRELLQEAALTSEALARSPTETPSEYQRRLLRHMQQQMSNARTAPAETAPSSASMLDTLTRAYDDERYGGKQTNESQRRRLQDWMPRLLSRMSDKTRRQ
jgi:hypothetical protein